MRSHLPHSKRTYKQALEFLCFFGLSSSGFIFVGLVHITRFFEFSAFFKLLYHLGLGRQSPEVRFQS